VSPDAAALDDVLGDAVALLRALQLGDEDAFDTLLATIYDPYPLVALLAGQLDEAAAARYGRERWNAACAAWRPGRGLISDPER